MLNRHMKIAIATLGCKTNFFESSSIRESFPEAELVDFSQEADLYIINTCTVTNRTDFKSRNLIRKALERKEKNPSAVIVVTGCYAQREHEEIESMGEIDFIVDNHSKLDIAKIMTTGNNPFVDIMDVTNFNFKPVTNMMNHTRAFQKIQDGCDFYCSYCAVPYARGHNRSAKFQDVIHQAKLFAENGFKEIVLGGVNLGLYKDGDYTLEQVIEQMERVDGLDLVRFSSIEPQLLTGRLLDVLSQSDKFCPHFHIPLQSGSDTILQRMKRSYDTDYVTALVGQIHDLFPTAAIGFDVICGFPGESQSEFDLCSKFLTSLDFTYLHVFSYSKRRGTPAASLADQVPSFEKQIRNNILSNISDTKKAKFIDRLNADNTIVRGVVEKSQDGINEILSDHYLRARFSGVFNQGDFVELHANTCVLF